MPGARLATVVSPDCFPAVADCPVCFLLLMWLDVMMLGPPSQLCIACRPSSLG